MLDRYSRAAVAALSVLCIAGVVASAPTRAHGLHRQAAAAAPPPAFPAIAQIDVRRDPFAGEPAQAPPVSSAGIASSSGSTAAPEGVGADAPASGISALPGNLATSAIPDMPGEPHAPGGSSRVTAIVTGTRPYAMIETAGDHAIRGIGDRVDGKPIVAIDIDGVTLSGGSRLSVNTQAAR